jgi:hypothetical protein
MAKSTLRHIIIGAVAITVAHLLHFFIGVEVAQTYALMSLIVLIVVHL